MNTTAPADTLLARLDSLADPLRLRLLALLEKEELGVGELAEILQQPQSSVSRHLKLLGEQGWVVSRSERTANLYRMANGELPEPSRRLWELTRGELESWPALEHDRLRLRRRLAARAREGDSRRFFAGVAGEWERLRRELYGDRFTEAALAALLPADWVVADLACGSGDVAVRLAPRVTRVVAVDQSPEMLAAARRRAEEQGVTADRLDLREGALEALPIESGSCDAALLLLALSHVEEPERVARETARILKPGGRAVVVDLLHHDRDDFRRRLGQLRNGFTARELERLLAAAGLGSTTCAPLPPEADAKGPALLLATGIRSGRPARTAGGGTTKAPRNERSREQTRSKPPRPRVEEMR